MMSIMPFNGLRVLSLESRRAAEIATLIRNQKGEPLIAPSMREIPLEHNEQAFAFGLRLFAGEFEMMILLTGVGTRLLNRVLDTRFPGRFAEALRSITVVARGPKPAAALREMQVPIHVQVPEPNTWRELLAAIDGRPERRIAVQEYGRPSPELIDGLRDRGADVTSVCVYQYDLPEDLEPLRKAVQELGRGSVDVVLFTSAIQATHLLQIAEREGIDIIPALRRTVIASIGPTTTEALEAIGIHPDVEPTHPKMGFLVAETAREADRILRAKHEPA